MSAFIVSKGHIRFLVEAALRLDRHGFSWWSPAHGARRSLKKFRTADGDLSADELGALLWEENVKSVDHRYSEENGVGPYKHARSSLPVDPVQVLKAADCYVYQTCEHPEWETSEAKHIIDALKADAINALPGYESALWGAPEAWENEDENKVVALTDLL